MAGVIIMQLFAWIIVLGAVIAVVNSKKNKIQTPQDSDKKVYYERKTVQPQKNFAVMPEHKKVPPNVERKCMVEDKHASENNVYARRDSKSTATPNVKRPYTEHSTQTREERNKNRMVATRLYEGDRVPQGCRMVKCKYCGAENLITYFSKGDYVCYFCHEDL